MREMWWPLGRVTGLIRMKPKLLRPLRSAITMQSHPSVSTSLRRASQTRSVPAPASPSRRAHQQISKVCRRVLADIQRRHVRYVFPRKRMRHPEPTSWYAHSTEMDRHPSARTSKVWTRRDQRSPAVTRAYHLLCEILVCAIDRVPISSPSGGDRLQASHRRCVSSCHADLQNPSAHHGTSEQPSRWFTPYPL